ncbi:glycosyltransferase [Paenibacillus sp. FSL R7-0204]|uniref:glycosyltransferase family 2 protein n=1 Tax=Paenibacillus sp. FSL R7-0204 TaxID=2921675 RepID=UPI0030FAF7C2
MNKYSFVIPSYNCKKLLRNTLKSLDYLITNKNIGYEVIVVDDGSDDGTGRYIQEINVKYEIKYIYLKRGHDSSRARARNEGMRAATGNIIVFIDADIIVRPKYLLNLDKFYMVSDEIAVTGIRVLMNQDIDDCMVDDKSIYDERRLKRRIGMDFRYDIFEDLSYNAGGMTAPFLYALTCNLAVPKKWIDTTTGFDEELIKWGIEDIEFVYRMYCQGMRIAINPKDYVIHQFHGVEQTDVIDDKYEEDIKYNTNIFIKKHPAFLGLSNEKVYELFRSIGTRYKDIERNDVKESIIINVTQEDRIEEFKKKITTLCKDKKINIVINDYVKDSDLYLWIQLLDNVNAKIKYYSYPRVYPVFGENHRVALA